MSTPLTAGERPLDEVIEELRGLEAKATPGPWFVAGPPWFDSGSAVLAASPDPHAGYLIVDTETWEGERAEYLENGGRLKLAHPNDEADFIAAARNALPRLLAELDASREREAALAARVGELERFVDQLAAQRIEEERLEEDEDGADFEDAFHHVVYDARRLKAAALSPQPQQKEGG